MHCDVMKNRSYHSVIAVFIILLVSCVFFNTVANGHFHKIGNRLIYHAHPYPKDAGNDGAFPNHQHSEFDLFFHEMMTNLLFHCLIVGGFVLWLSVLSRTVPFDFLKVRFGTLVESHVPRAPPALFAYQSVQEQANNDIK